MKANFCKFMKGKQLFLLATGILVLVFVGVSVAYEITHQHVYMNMHMETPFTVQYAGTHYDGAQAPNGSSSNTQCWVQSPTGDHRGDLQVLNGAVSCQSFNIPSTGTWTFISDVFWNAGGNTVNAWYWDKYGPVPAGCPPIPKPDNSGGE